MSVENLNAAKQYLDYDDYHERLAGIVRLLDAKDVIVRDLLSQITTKNNQLAASEGKRKVLGVECLSGRNKEAAHHHDCQYVGCIEKSQCPAWSAEKDYEAAKAATDAASAMGAP